MGAGHAGDSADCVAAVVYAFADAHADARGRNRTPARRSAATGRRSPRDIRRWGRALGFEEIGIADTDLAAEERRLLDWLAAGRHGAMDYMARHGATRARPAELVPGTLRVITARMNYRPPAARASAAVLADPTKAFVARYALGRDYHKVLRGRLQQLADRIAPTIGDFGYRVFTDSAPVLEVALAAKAGLGWQRQAHAAAHARRRARGSSWARSTPTCRCRRRRRRRRTAAAAARASTSARRARSSRPMSSTRAAASRT